MAINSDDPLGVRLAALIAEGRHADAGALALAEARPGDAATIYEQIWDFAAAAAAAERAGDLPRALENAIRARDEPRVQALIAATDGDADDAVRRSARDALARQRRFADAAPLAERAGERDLAIDYYDRAGRDLDAARLLEDAGRDREAGRRLERLIDLGAGADAAEAHLRLGRILARRMSWEPAARHLQEAARHDATRAAARRLLISALAALGLLDGARDVLLAARRDDPALPAELDVFLRAARDGDSDRRREGAERSELVIGRYRLERLLGAGGSGRVFLARDEVSGKSVALKMFHAATARGGPGYERFVREARVASAMRHPALVEVYDFSAEHGLLVMELMSGGSLAARVGAPMPGGLVRRMALELLGGLEVAHHRGIVHRDVKPANVFFDSRGNAKLGDFGVAHLLDLGQTQTGGLIGTLAYMAPEQITGAPLTITADFYALGITLYEALAGRLPFLGPDFVAQHLGEQPAPPSALHPPAAPWDALVLHLLRKSPSERPESIAALRQRLAALDLGDAAHAAALVLPRARRLSRPTGAVGVASETAATDEAAVAGPRYQFETPIGATPVSQLARAVDTTLNRSVIIERFEPSLQQDDATRAMEQRLFALARGGGPFVQRSLSYDRASRTAVYEAPAGIPIGEAWTAAPPTPHEALRVLKRLARAVAALHETGHAHGKLGPTTILLDDAAVPTVLVSGLGPIATEPTAADDVAAILALLGEPLRCPPRLDALASALGVAGAVPSTPPAHGEALYAAADELERAVLRAARGAAERRR